MSLIPINHIVATYRENNTNTNGNAFAARPLKQWRKQYQNILGTSRAAVGMPMDRPGGFIPVASKNIQCTTCNGAFPARIDIFKSSNCTSCNPIKTKVKPLVTNFTDINAYFQSRCLTYEQKLNTTRIDASVNYFYPDGTPTEPSNSSTGSQVYSTANCYNNKPPLVCNTTIYKPNNTQFAQQGGVSSSTRLARLKYNTLNNMPVVNNGITVNGSVFNTAAGAMGLNSGRYQLEPTPAYYTKPKPQAAVCYRRNGNKIYCPIILSPPQPQPPPIVKINYAYVSYIYDLSLNVYLLDANGLLIEPPIQSLSTSSGLTAPSSSTTFVTINNNNYVYVICNSSIGLSGGISSIVSFSVKADGTLLPLFSPITGLSYPWDITSVTIGSNTYVYVSDFYIGSISIFFVEPNGQLQLLTPVGVVLNSITAITSITINDTVYLYVAANTSAVGSILVYLVESDGSLTQQVVINSLGLNLAIGMTSVTINNSIYLYVNNLNPFQNNSQTFMFQVDKTTLGLTSISSPIASQYISFGIKNLELNNIYYVYRTEISTISSTNIKTFSIYNIDPTGILVPSVPPAQTLTNNISYMNFFSI
jgi:hypothetical protein